MSRDDHGAVVFFGHFNDIGCDTLCAHDDQDARAPADQVLLGLGVVAGDDDPLLYVKLIQAHARHGDDADFAVDVGQGIVVDDPSVDRLADALGRRALQQLGGAVRIAHGNVCRIASRDDAQEFSLFIHDPADLPVVLLQDLYSLSERLIRGDRNRFVQVNLAQLKTCVLKEHRLFKSKAFEQIFGLCAELPEAAGDGLDPVCPFIKCISYCRGHGIRIRMFMARNVYAVLIHMRYLPIFNNLPHCVSKIILTAQFPGFAG